MNAKNRTLKGHVGVKRIHVNQHNIRANSKGEDRPVITCKTSSGNHYGHHVEIHGPSLVVYPDKPMACGAKVWIETLAAITIFDRDGNHKDVK